jgi:hypothetical protein
MARAPSVLETTASSFSVAAAPRKCASRRIPVVLTALFIAVAGFSRPSEDFWREAHFLSAAILIPYLALGRGAVFARCLRLCWPLLLLVVLGFCVTLADGALFERDTLKGLWYTTRIPVYVIFGAMLTSRITSLESITDILLSGGVVLALHFLVAYYSDSNVVSADRLYIRSQIGHGYLITAFAIVLAFHKLFVEKKTGLISGVLVVGAATIMTASILLSDSRSNLYGQAVLILFTFSAIPSAWFGRSMVLLALIVLVTLTTPAIQFFISSSELARLGSALPGSLNELIAIDRATNDEINDYWRGYETFSAFSFVTAHGFYSTLFGIGLHGAVIVSNTPPDLGDPLNDAIPIFHNGFAFAYVRAGILGLALFIWQHVTLASQAKPLVRSCDLNARFFGRLYCGLMMLMIIEIPTTSGLLNYDEAGSTSCILLGLLIGFAWNIRYGLAPLPLVPNRGSSLPISIR